MKRISTAIPVGRRGQRGSRAGNCLPAATVAFESIGEDDEKDCYSTFSFGDIFSNN